MKFKVLVALFIGLFFLIFSFGLAQGTQEDAQGVEITENIPEPARISYVEGVVKLNAENAEVNLPVIAADEVITEDGRIEIALGKGDYIRLDKNTRLRFVEFTKDSTRIFLERGGIYIKVHAQIVDVESRNFSYPVKNEFVRIEADERGTNKKSCPQTPADDFDSFNETREEELAPAEKTESSKNLPEELGEYESELSRNGEWREHERYGHVWIPHADYGWRPYYYGHWTWIPLLGWFWVSDEPFGWCTYHYGRWHWDPMWGSWYWIPTTIWGPAWVNWYGWDNYYGWCPRWHDRWYYDRYYDSYYRYGYGRTWTFVRKDQLKNRNIHTVAARRSELQSMGRIDSAQLLRKSAAPTLNQLSRSSSQQSNRSVGSIQNRQSPSRIQSTSPSRKDSLTRIQNREAKTQNYPSRLSLSRDTRRQSSRFDSPRTDLPRSSRPSSEFRSSRQSYSPTQRFLAPQTPRFSAAPRSFSPSRSFSASSRPSVSSRPSASSSRGPSGSIRKK